MPSISSSTEKHWKLAKIQFSESTVFLRKFYELVAKKNSILAVCENADLANVKVNEIRLTALKFPFLQGVCRWCNDFTKMNKPGYLVKKEGMQKGSNQVPFRIVSINET